MNHWPPGTGIAIGIALGVALGTGLGNLALGISLGVVFGIVLDASHRRRNCGDACAKADATARGPKPDTVPANAVNEQRAAAKQGHLDQVMTLARARNEITNDDIEKELGVSDATAGRYLEELKAQGALEQVGDTGRGVSYRPK
jgi:hypothetical protein